MTAKAISNKDEIMRHTNELIASLNGIRMPQLEKVYAFPARMEFLHDLPKLGDPAVE